MNTIDSIKEKESKKILQISIEVNSGSVGRIAEQIGELILDKRWESYITFARNNLPSKSQTIKIGTLKDVYWHVLTTRIFDNHCFESKTATHRLINQIKLLKPDLIHLHHLHGYFINIDILFKYLSEAKIPLVWTFHDCWSFTGHCTHFEYIKCEKWKTQCFKCPNKKEYPKSLLIDRSYTNYTLKKELFTSVENLSIVTPSKWLENLVLQSFFKKYPTITINNGIDLDKFKPVSDSNNIKEKYNIGDKFIILGVASMWDEKKGINFFHFLNDHLEDDEIIILVGLTESQIKKLPQNIIGIKRTESVEELASLYSISNVFFNPTLEDTYPTTNLESIACGTPVITFDTGGSVESVNEGTGFVIEKNDISTFIERKNVIKRNGKDYYKKYCRSFALANFSKIDRFQDYINLYSNLLKV